MTSGKLKSPVWKTAASVCERQPKPAGNLSGRRHSCCGVASLALEQASCGRHLWLWFDEHLWLACRICEVRLQWHASVLSGIVSRRVERGTKVENVMSSAQSH